ncbi:uncharacterized protein LOC125490318 [Plutella xylostella]|uniref:uncharacterized protein LOC125490318 n=1 Tax=Plutella xylostella TaxID=51655 RepID=UPI002032827D|nr:uncharacterized protein LOC125490318 [Plutella xylostella]
MSTSTLKCNTCNLVINELLSYIQNKISVIDEDTLLRICTSAFSNDEIQKSKSLLFDAVPTTKRKIQRKKEGKGHRDLEDIMSLFKSVPAEVMPVFVSRELEKLPPVTFDHLDCTQLLKDIVRLQAEINNIKETYVTSTQLQEFKSELQVKNNSPLLPICSVNTRRGAWCLDSGPIGLSQCDIASVNDSLDTITKTPTSTKAMKDSSPNSNISEQHTVAVDNTKSTHKLSYRNISNDAAEGMRSEFARCDKPPTMTSCEISCADKGFEASAKMNEKLVNKQDDWQTVSYRKKKSSYRYSGLMGTAACESNNNFKAADRSVPVFITNVHKETTVPHMVDYIKLKTQECVSLEKIYMKRKADHNAYKFFVPEHKLPLFLNENIWPKGIIFRRFVHFKPKDANGGSTSGLVQKPNA